MSKLNELEFTYEKICSNFSNYSAWHYRSKLIEHLYKENQIDLNIFKNELNLIEQALFTDPNDQSKSTPNTTTHLYKGVFFINKINQIIKVLGYMRNGYSLNISVVTSKSFYMTGPQI